MDRDHTATVKEDNNVFSALLFRFLPYWPLFLLLILSCLAIAWAYVQYTTPMYAAAATLEVKDQRKGVEESKMVESFNVYNTNKIVENEIEVIKSRTLATQVVDSLHLYAPIREESRLKSVSAYSSSPIIIEAKDPEQIISTAKIYFTWNDAKSQVSIGNESYLLNQWVKTPYGVLRFTKNVHQKRNAANRLYFSLHQPKSIAAGFLYNLDVSSISKLSSIISLKLKDEDPHRAEDFLNELAKAYNRGLLNDKNRLAVNTLAFLEDRISLVQHELDSIEKTIQQYRSKKGVIDLSEQGRMFLQNVGINDNKVVDISMKLAVLDQIEKYVLQKDKQSGIAPSTLGVSDPVLSNLVQTLSEKELQYQNQKQTVGEGNTILTSIKSEIDQLRPLVLENVRNQRQGLVASNNTLSAKNNMFNSMLRTLPQQEKDMLEISRQQTIKTNAFSFLLQKREETALSYAATVSDGRIIDKAQASMVPVSPRKTLIYLGALTFALILSIGLICSKELLSNKVLFRSQIENFTKVPIAAEIASVKNSPQLAITDLKTTFVAEQFRHLRAAIGLYGKSVSKKKLLITSSISGEGKSFVATNLSASLALAGKKVVLIDADLRCPQTSSFFAYRKTKGLAEYLEGNADIDEIIRECEVKNLFIIPAGTSAVNATELLINGNLNQLFAYLEQSFDHVIIDTSPVDPVTDAYVLSEYCNKTLFVVRHGYTPKTMIQLLDKNNKVKALRNLAIVFNGVKRRGFFKRGYGFGYGYGYEYVYNQSSRDKYASNKS